jgi:hypothetical protein
MYLCVVLCIVCFVTFPVLFVCTCVLYYCHRVATQLQLNISYPIIIELLTCRNVSGGPDIKDTKVTIFFNLKK